MKKVLPVFLFLFFFQGFAIAQFIGVDSDSDKFRQFLRSTTLVVLQDDDEEYNNALKKAMKAQWKVTPYDFITSKDIAAYSFNEFFSVLMTMSLNSQGFENYHSSYFAVLLCGRKNLSATGFPITVAAKVVLDIPGACPLCYPNSDHVDLNVSQLCRAIEIAKNNRILVKYPETMRREYIRDRKELTEKMLLVQENIFRPASVKSKKWLSKDEFRGIYPYRFQAATDHEIDQLIQRKDSSVLIMYKEFDPVDAEKYFYLVVSPADGRIVYLPPFTKEARLERKMILEMVEELKR